MSLFVLTINNLSPAADARHQEVERIHQYAEIGLAAVRSAGGGRSSGNITIPGGSTVVGSWTYTAQAPS
jgi:hypothetical protein